jgi:hypothetical protein
MMKPTTAIVIGGFVALLVGLMLDWLGMNLAYNLYDSAALIIWLYFILGITLALVGAVLLLTKQRHAFLGSFLFILGIILAIWAFIYLIPIYDWEYGEWFTWGFWGW